VLAQANFPLARVLKKIKSPVKSKKAFQLKHITKAVLATAAFLSLFAELCLPLFTCSLNFVS